MASVSRIMHLLIFKCRKGEDCIKKEGNSSLRQQFLSDYGHIQLKYAPSQIITAASHKRKLHILNWPPLVFVA